MGGDLQTRWRPPRERPHCRVPQEGGRAPVTGDSKDRGALFSLWKLYLLSPDLGILSEADVYIYLCIYIYVYIYKRLFNS